MNELLIVLVIVLLLFGGKKIPELLRGVGKGVGELQKGLDEGRKQFNKGLHEDEEKPLNAEAKKPDPKSLEAEREARAADRQAARTSEES